ncbi:MAG: hypothetical protein EXR73_03445 [Myxococcales bacterium]|nr:hypothetical protein [Myxococcales bacterium]
MRALAMPHQSVQSIAPTPSYLSVAIPRPADACYRLFADVERIPEWLSVVRSAYVSRRDQKGRAREVAFLARLRGATVGYTCRYRHHEEDLLLAWSTTPGSSLAVQGFGQFVPLGDRAALMTYSLELDLGPAGSLPGWHDSFFDGHAASSAMSDFRDFAQRAL